MYKAIIKRWDGRDHILLDSDRDYLEEFARFVVCKLEDHIEYLEERIDDLDGWIEDNL